MENKKKEYQTPQLTVYGTVEDVTQGWFGQYSDWIQGDPDPPGLCNPDNPWWGRHCPTS